jgi:hypothetical protein
LFISLTHHQRSSTTEQPRAAPAMGDFKLSATLRGHEDDVCTPYDTCLLGCTGTDSG